MIGPNDAEKNNEKFDKNSSFRGKTMSAKNKIGQCLKLYQK